MPIDRRLEAWLDRHLGFGDMDAASVEAIAAARGQYGRGAIHVVALIAALASLVVLVGVALGVFVRKDSPLWPLYLVGLGLEFLVMAFFALRWFLDEGRGGQRIFVGLGLFIIVHLNLLGMYAVGDRSIYLFGLLGSALIISAPLGWYLLAFGLAWLYSLAGLVLVFPPGARLNHAIILSILTALSVAAGLVLELGRMRSAVLRCSLELSNRELQELSIRDSLTGLYNRRFLVEWLDHTEAWAERNGRPICLAMVDLDLFKRVNDEAGHAVGDAVLVEAARILAAGLRKTDLVARYGGDEFLLVLPDTAREAALALIDRLRVDFRGLSVEGWGQALSFSAGLAERSQGEASSEVIRRADTLLYRAKAGGRDHVEA